MYSEEVEESKVIVLVILSDPSKTKVQDLTAPSDESNGIDANLDLLITCKKGKGHIPHIIQYKTLYHYHHLSPKYRAFLSPKYRAFMSRLFAEHMRSCWG